MRNLLIMFMFACLGMSQASPVGAECLHYLCGTWSGMTTVANNDDPSAPFTEVGMVIEITAVEEPGRGGQLFVGTVAFQGMSGPLAPFDLTGIRLGKALKASTAGTVLSAVLTRDRSRMRGYYLDTLIVPGTQAHPQTGKFTLDKE